MVGTAEGASAAHGYLEALMDGVRTICNAADQLAALHGLPKEEILASRGSESSYVAARSFAVQEAPILLTNGSASKAEAATLADQGGQGSSSCTPSSTTVTARSLQSLTEEVKALRKQLTMTQGESTKPKGRLHGSGRSSAAVRPSAAGAKALELQQLMLHSEVFAEREELEDGVNFNLKVLSREGLPGGPPLGDACSTNGTVTAFQQANPPLTSSPETLLPPPPPPPPLPMSSAKSAATSVSVESPQKGKAFVFESSPETPFSFTVPVAGSGDTLASPPAPTYKTESVDVPLTPTRRSYTAVLMQPWSAIDPTSLDTALQQWEAAQEAMTLKGRSSITSRRFTNVAHKRSTSASISTGPASGSRVGTSLGIETPGPAASKSAQQLAPESKKKKNTTQRHRCSCMRPGWVLHPMSFTRVLWDGLCLIVVAIGLLGFPLLAFDLEKRAPRHILDAVALFHASFWTLDMIMSVRTGFTEGPVLVMDAKAAAMHYLKTWFLFDLILVGRDWGERTLHKYTRPLILLRTIKLPLHIGKFEEAVNSPPVTIMLSVVKLGAILGVAVHCITCAWWWIGQLQTNGWAHKEQVVMEGFFLQYFYSARWALAQVNGRVDQARDRTMLELAFTSVVACFTVIIMSIFIALITTRMMELQNLVDIATKNSRTLRHYLEQHSSISYTFTFYAKKYVKGQEGLLNHADNEDQVLKMLPPKLQKDLLHEVRSPTLIRHSLLRDIDSIHPPSLKLLCSQACSLVHVASTEVLFERGDACSRMLFIDEGELRYIQVGLKKKMAFRGLENLNLDPAALENSEPKQGMFSRLLELVGLQDLSPGEQCASPSHWRGGGTALESLVSDGAVLCEPSLWFEWRNVGDMVAAKNCQLIALDAAAFVDVVKSFSDAFRLVSLYALCYHSMFHSSLEPTERARNDLTRLDIGCLADYDFGAADIGRFATRTATVKTLMSKSAGHSLLPAPPSGSIGEEQCNSTTDFAERVGSDTFAAGP